MTDSASPPNRGTLTPAKAPQLRAWLALYVAIATLLIAAAILKAYQAATALPGVPVHLRLLDLALIEFELALGGMLLLNVWPIGAWGLAIAAFTVFAGVSVEKALSGAKSCGCFGPAAVDPRLMVVIDLLVVVLLVLAGPRPPMRSAAVSFVRRALTRAGSVVIITLMLLAAAGVAFAALPKRGLVAEKDGVHDFGVIPADQAGSCEHTFVVRNTSSRPIRITGWRSSCQCAVAQLPDSPIPPGGAEAVRVRADWSGTSGIAIAQVILETDNLWTPKVPLKIHGEVEPRGSGE
jgi:hypothetical protein